MTKAEFNRFLSEFSKKQFTDFELQKTSELINLINENLLEKIAFSIATDSDKKLQRGYLNLKSLMEIVREVIIENAEFKAKNTGLANSPFGSRYEDERWLFKWFLHENLKNLPQWAVDFIRQPPREKGEQK